MIPLIINSFKLDLESFNEHNVCLALSAICNIGGKEMAESLVPDVEKLLIAKNSTPNIKKKASMCLLRLYQKNKDTIEPSIWYDRVKELLGERDLGFLTSFMSFVNFLASNYPNVFKPLYKKITTLLSNSVNGKLATDQYIYHRVPTPWLTIKLLKFIQIYPIPENLEEAQQIVDIITDIISSSVSPSSNSTDTNTVNITNSILFEAIKTAIHLRTASVLSERCCKILCEFLTNKNSNIKYLSLELLSTIALTIPESLGMIKKYHRTIASSLRDRDISIRRRSLDLVYSICDSRNYIDIVNELLDYLDDLNTNILTDYEIREDIILKIAILAERNSYNSKWYVDVIVRLISLAGESMNDEIWHRSVKVIVNSKDVQHYAISKTFIELKQDACNESMIKLASYLLGEYSHYLVENRESSPSEIFSILNSKFKTSEEDTKAIILSSFMKLSVQYPNITENILNVLEQNMDQVSPELQQRSVEYMSLIRLNNPELLKSVCEPMPPFKEREEKVDEYVENNTSTSSSPVIKKKKSKKSKKSKRDVTKSPFDSSYSEETVSDSDIDEVVNDEKTMVLFKKLCLLNQGVLYEDEVLQIGVKSEYQKGFGQLALFFGNKSFDTLNSFSCSVSSTSYLSIQYDQTFTSIAPGSQQKIIFTIQCLAPYQDIYPSVTISYIISGTMIRKKFNMPIPMSKFVEHINIDPIQFNDVWESIKEPESIQEVFKALHPINVPAIQKMIKLGFRLNIIEGVTNNLNNIVAGGQFICTQGKAVCLLLFETNSKAQMIRMTLKSSNVLVGKALRSVILEHMSAPSH